MKIEDLNNLLVTMMAENKHLREEGKKIRESLSKRMGNMHPRGF